MIGYVEIVEIDSLLRGFGVLPHLISSRRPIEGSETDMVACVSYRLTEGAPLRWGVVQRVGPCWSATLDLDVREATRRATAIARREGGQDGRLRTGGPGA